MEMDKKPNPGEDEQARLEAEEREVARKAEEAAAELERAESELARARKEIETLKDKYMRLMADFDNYRKRMQAEVEAARKEGEIKAIRAVLPVLDDLERALEHAGAKPETIAEGVRAVHQWFQRILSGLGVEPVPGEGEPFDPNVHEAIGVVEGEEDEKVAEVYQKGYVYGEQLIRPARVAVTKKKEVGGGK
ncbi:nucleotide exchange factor GrpE [Oceanithermus sp.]|uniref:nucleotide exchange factor GrpE n=1 Tax=Oceanithermus sp. TaxID=2268145 RepID=UPI0025DACB88|nr:nucleotide exchange factor GrpE [Oceanithermus sp.]